MGRGRLPRNKGKRTSDPGYYEKLVLIVGSQNTNSSYGSQLKNWQSYCESNNINPDELNQDLPDSIARWLAKRVMIDGLSKSTLDQCYSSVKDYYRTKHKRDGTWSVENGISKGNPYNSIDVQDAIKHLKRATAPDTVVRSLAISLADLGKLDKYLDTSQEYTSVEAAWYKALFSIAFYCWFRLDEPASLQRSDVIWNLSHHADPNLKYDKIKLDHRKTNQTRDHSDDYNIYDEVEEPNLMVATKLRTWKKIYDAILDEEGISPEARDNFYLFCKVQGTNIYPTTKMPTLTNLDDMCMKAGKLFLSAGIKSHLRQNSKKRIMGQI